MLQRVAIYRPNPEMDELSECHRAGWQYLTDHGNYKPEDWTSETTDAIMARVALRGGVGDATVIKQLGIDQVYQSSACDSNGNWMILSAGAVRNSGIVIEYSIVAD